MFVLECCFCYALTDQIGPCSSCGKYKFTTTAVDMECWIARGPSITIHPVISSLN